MGRDAPLSQSRSLSPRGTRSGQRGLTLVELMVAIALSMFMVAALVTLYVNNSAARTELDRASRQIENGRYAIDLLRDNLALAGYYGELSRRDAASFTTPNPCTTALASMGWPTAAAPTPLAVPAAVQGPQPSTTIPASWGCGSLNQRAGTGYLVLRHVEPEPLAATAAAAGTAYLQSAGCLDATQPFVLGTGPGAGNFTLTAADCASAAPVRAYVSRLFFVADCGVCSPSDGVPTLKLLELRDGAMVERIVADGIEDLQFEFGRDTSGDGVADDYLAATSDAADWGNVVAVRVRLISRATSPSPGYVDDKTYDRGSLFAAYLPADTRFKRRAYTALVQLPNVAGPRESP